MKGVFSSYAKEQFREERWLAMVDSRSSRRELDEYNAVADMEVLEDIILAYDVWIIHRLYLEFEPLIKKAKSRGVKVVIQTWGPDYMHVTAQYPLDVLLPKSKLWWEGYYSHSGLRKLYREWIVWPRKAKRIRKVLSMADSVHFCLPSETTGVSGIHESPNCRFSYTPAPSDIISPSSTPSEDWVILGNSGDPTNNHLDALHKLKERFVPVERLLIPFSYAAPAGYLETVHQEDVELFGAERVEVLSDFLQPDEYITKIAPFGTLMLYHKRQQAVGSFLLALQQGKTILLHSEGKLNQWLLSDFGLDFGESKWGHTQGDDITTNLISEYFSTARSERFIQLSRGIGES